MSKRSFQDVSTTNAVQVDAKTVRSANGSPRPVGEYGSEQQIRTAATATVSPDAVRFIPRQVRKSNSNR